MMLLYDKAHPNCVDLNLGRASQRPYCIEWGLKSWYDVVPTPILSWELQKVNIALRPKKERKKLTINLTTSKP